jgi:hypothetical protein
MNQTRILENIGLFRFIYQMLDLPAVRQHFVLSGSLWIVRISSIGCGRTRQRYGRAA